MNGNFIQILIAIGGLGTLGFLILTSQATDFIKSITLSLLISSVVIMYLVFVIEPRIKKLEGAK